MLEDSIACVSGIPYGCLSILYPRMRPRRMRGRVYLAIPAFDRDTRSIHKTVLERIASLLLLAASSRAGSLKDA